MNNKIDADRALLRSELYRGVHGQLEPRSATVSGPRSERGDGESRERRAAVAGAASSFTALSLLGLLHLLSEGK